MQEIDLLIRHVNQTINSSGKYQALFFISLVFLYVRNRRKGNKLFYYCLCALFLLLNPAFVWMICKLFPYFTSYWQLLWLIPQTGVMVTAACHCYELIREHASGAGNRAPGPEKRASGPEKRASGPEKHAPGPEKWASGAERRASGAEKRAPLTALLILAVLILMAGTIFSDPPDLVRAENSYGLGEEELEVLSLLEDSPDILLLAPDSLMAAARRYSGEIRTLYGRDISQASVAERAGLKDKYDPELYQLHAWMQAPWDYPQQIAGIAFARGCTHLLLELSPDRENIDGELEQAGFLPAEETDVYKLYIRQDY